MHWGIEISISEKCCIMGKIIMPHISECRHFRSPDKWPRPYSGLPYFLKADFGHFRLVLIVTWQHSLSNYNTLIKTITHRILHTVWFWVIHSLLQSLTHHVLIYSTHFLIVLQCSVYPIPWDRCSSIFGNLHWYAEAGTLLLWGSSVRSCKLEYRWGYEQPQYTSQTQLHLPTQFNIPPS